MPRKKYKKSKTRAMARVWTERMLMPKILAVSYMRKRAASLDYLGDEEAAGDFAKRADALAAEIAAAIGADRAKEIGVLA